MIGLHVFDENLQKIWGGEFEMPYTENRMKITDCKFTFDGSVYLLIKVLKENTVDLIGNYHYEVLTFQKNNTDQKPIVLNVGQYTPITAFLYEDEAHEVHVVNTYAKQHEGKTIYDVANGICFGKIVGNEYVPDPLKPGFYEIPLDAISQGASEKEMKMLKKDPDRIGIENLNIRNVYRMPDGSTKIIAEDYDIGYSGTTDLSSHPVTFARDVVIFSIDVNGKLEWVRVVPKNQVWGDGTGIGASLNSISKENTLHLFFVDTNNQGTPDYVHSNDIGAKFYIIAVTILPNGEIKRYSLGQIKGDKYYLMLRKFEKMGDDNLMGNSYRDNDNKLFSIKIE